MFWLFVFAASLYAQMPYYGPTSPAANTIQVQLRVYDQSQLGGAQIESVRFNGTNIPLQPPDLQGFRGGGGFQLQPGSYQLEWKTTNPGVSWPRSLTYTKTIVIKTQDTWVQVMIQGDQATVL